ncbi:MAG: hypothetical protein JEZ07_18330 [Phycisphaerae bacterium]|nr:hypothetical protein [Phycisphaerae bacterium]
MLVGYGVASQGWVLFELAYDAAGNTAIDQDGYLYDWDYENRPVRIYRPENRKIGDSHEWR